MQPKPRVLIVDDSALIRQLLTDILSRDGGLEIVGHASDPYKAVEKIKALRPDVLTLDVEMPRMDGLTFLEKLMRIHPMPVVMVSSLTEKGCATTLRALELGAVDFVTKPKVDVASGTLALGEDIVEKVRGAAGAGEWVRRRSEAKPKTAQPAPLVTTGLIEATHRVIAIGASTGGTEALREVLTAMPDAAPGIVVVQHMPQHFTSGFSARLDSLCRIRVREARDGDRVLPGHALIAPGDFHMAVRRSGANYDVRVERSAPVNRHRPSVDVLFHSCAQSIGPQAIGVILTGMGNDGAAGLRAIRDAGGRTIAQDEATCVVFGMPREAIALGGAETVEPLGRIAAAALNRAVSR
jgi:two-component system, chemotaxis family, protein-glutamate methylesterase/glutaminase